MAKLRQIHRAILILAVFPSILWGQPFSGQLEVHFINVGQADASLVISPRRECVMLIDSGDTRYPASAKNFKSYIQRQLPLGTRIDIVIASHPHNDHIGSLQW